MSGSIGSPSLSMVIFRHKPACVNPPNNASNGWYNAPQEIDIPACVYTFFMRGSVVARKQNPRTVRVIRRGQYRKTLGRGLRYVDLTYATKGPAQSTTNSPCLHGHSD